MERNNGRIVQLDGVRGIAVMMVVLYHLISLQYDKMEKAGLNGVERVLDRLTSIGWCGVDLFFILSGFLIGNILLKNIKSPDFFKSFYIRRFFRIVPIYYVLLIVFLLLKCSPWYRADAVVFEQDIPLWYYFLFLQNFAMGWYNSFGPNATSISWSLAVEEQFYLIMPVLLYYIKPRYYIYIIIVGLLIAPLSRMVTDNYYIGYTWLICRINSPMLGFLIALLMQKQGFQTWVRKNFGMVQIFTAFFLVLAVLVHIFLKAGAFNHTLIGLACALIVLVALFADAGPLNRLLTARILVYLGGISYFIYLFHLLINDMLHLVILHQTWPMLDSPASIWLTIAGFALTLILGTVSYRYFEGPLINKGHKHKY